MILAVKTQFTVKTPNAAGGPKGISSPSNGDILIYFQVSK